MTFVRNRQRLSLRTVESVNKTVKQSKTRYFAGAHIGCFAITVFLCLLHSTTQAELVVRFKQLANPDATRLGDLLVIQPDEKLWSGLLLQSHPQPGEVITKQKMLMWMHQQLGSFNATWQGKTHLTIQTKGAPKQAMIDKAKNALLDKLKPTYAHIVVKPLTKTLERDYALEDLTVKINLHYPIAKRVCVWLIPKDTKQRRIALWFAIRAYAKVPVLRHGMPINTLLKKEDISFKNRDIAGLTDIPLTTLPQQALLKTSLPRDTILQSKHLKERPLVTPGEHIKVTVLHPPITITTDAIALDEGYRGQMITVKNPLNQQTFKARVNDFKKAEVGS